MQAAIQRKQRDRASRTEISQYRVLTELARLAFLDIRKAFNEDGTLKALHELDDDTAAAIAGFDMAEMFSEGDAVGVMKKFKLADKKGPLELLMRHMGMLNDKLKIQGDPENPVHVQTKLVIVPSKTKANVHVVSLEGEDQ